MFSVDSSTPLSPADSGYSSDSDRFKSPTSSPRRVDDSPDRFVPCRQPAVADAFRTAKDVHRLTPAEKLIRHHSVSPDAFTRPRAIQPAQGASPPLAALTTASTVRSGRAERQVSLGNVWTVGGLATAGVPQGRGRALSSGSHAPLYSSSFLGAKPTADQEREAHEGRLAAALDLDRSQRILAFHSPPTSPTKKTTWDGSSWVNGDPQRRARVKHRTLPTAPFKVLDAPNLRDDFYCSVLAYSPTCHTLAVGLGPVVYGWSESRGVQLLSSAATHGAWITTIAFSSAQGCKCILALGKSDCTLTLMSVYDRVSPRFEARQPSPIACVSWRPNVGMRPSRHPLRPSGLVPIEDLLVGDESGHVYYYAIEWPSAWEAEQSGWPGAMTLLARISMHTQQVCGLAWAPDGTAFATGGNDNICCVYDTSRIFAPASDILPSEEGYDEPDGVRRTHVVPARHARALAAGAERHRWVHGAAVKAIAFCPWRAGLIATGGGSNDRCIHFFHTVSGACLATISVSAQITSLIWSTTRREIAATFGYAQPEHPFRIGVFSWPECQQVAAIPWEGEHRALYAISYPYGPDANTRSPDGCIIVAASDESVKFHEVWAAGDKTTLGRQGLLGGSDILEGMEGFDKEGDIIR